MDFDQLLETWRAQNTAPPYDVNRDALRLALETEEGTVRRVVRSRRRVIWFLGIFGTGMAIALSLLAFSSCSISVWSVGITASKGIEHASFAVRNLSPKDPCYAKTLINELSTDIKPLSPTLSLYLLHIAALVNVRVSHSLTMDRSPPHAP